eukprot:4619851-Amphidinium_carterae.2
MPTDAAPGVGIAPASSSLSARLPYLLRCSLRLLSIAIWSCRWSSCSIELPGRFSAPVGPCSDSRGLGSGGPMRSKSCSRFNPCSSKIAFCSPPSSCKVPVSLPGAIGGLDGSRGAPPC